MDTNLTEAVQRQMNNERYNSQVYFALANMLENLAYSGLASWFRKQAQGEIEHAQKFAEFLISKRVVPNYTQLSSIFITTNLLGICKRAADLEMTTTSNLKDLHDLAEDDPQVEALLNWFLIEQIEEETVTQDLVSLVVSTDAAGWLVLDERYGKL